MKCYFNEICVVVINVHSSWFLKLWTCYAYFAKNISFRVEIKRYQEWPQANFKQLAMNETESKEQSLVKMCPMNEMVSFKESDKLKNLASFVL